MTISNYVRTGFQELFDQGCVTRINKRYNPGFLLSTNSRALKVLNGEEQQKLENYQELFSRLIHETIRNPNGYVERIREIMLPGRDTARFLVFTPGEMGESIRIPHVEYKDGILKYPELA